MKMNDKETIIETNKKIEELFNNVNTLLNGLGEVLSKLKQNPDGTLYRNKRGELEWDKKKIIRKRKHAKSRKI